MGRKEKKMSEPLKVNRQAGMIVLIGAVIGVVVSLLLNAAYSFTPDGADLPVPPWQPALERIAGSLLTFAPAIEVYHLFGRFVLLVLAAFLIGLYGLNAKERAIFGEKPPRLLIWGYRLAMTGLVLNLIGNIGDYWVSVAETIDLIVFVGGTVVGLLLIAIGLILLGIGGLRSASLPRPVAWALILWFPFSMVLLLVGMVNLPSAQLLALSLAWIITGISMIRSNSKEWALNKQSI
jgi:hypothetical protein